MKIEIVRQPQDPLLLRHPTVVQLRVIGSNEDTLVKCRIKVGPISLLVDGDPASSRDHLRSCNLEGFVSFKFESEVQGSVQAEFSTGQALIEVTFEFGTTPVHKLQRSNSIIHRNGKGFH